MARSVFFLARTAPSPCSTLFIPSIAPSFTRYHHRHQASIIPRSSKPYFGFQTKRKISTNTHITSCTSTPTPIASSASDPIPASAERTVLDELRERGLVDATTADDDLLKPLLSSPVSVYTGFDPTADSLHLGNYLALVAMRWFQKYNHTVVAVVGGATGKVGDPSGKSNERPILDDETIQTNLKGIEQNIKQVLSAQNLKVLNNHDWVGPITFLDFLRDVGKYARVNGMLAKDSVKTRISSEEGMSFTEFTYQLLQAFDFMYLNEHHSVTFQLGGSDQWGNITAGTELTRKIKNGTTLHGITFPLLTTSDGKKFGKSEDGAIWLSAQKLSPYQFYQYLFKTPDADVITFLKRLTFTPLCEIDQIEADMKSQNYKPNTAQRILAEQVTSIVHGEAGLQSALAATAAAAPGSKAVLSADALEAIAEDMPTANMKKSELIGHTIVDAMVHGGLQKSKSEARRLVKNGGAYMNNNKISDASIEISQDDLIDGRLILLAAGKKNKLLIRVEQ